MRELISDITPLPDIQLKPESDESRLYTLSYITDMNPNRHGTASIHSGKRKKQL